MSTTTNGRRCDGDLGPYERILLWRSADIASDEQRAAVREADLVIRAHDGRIQKDRHNVDREGYMACPEEIRAATIWPPEEGR